MKNRFDSAKKLSQNLNEEKKIDESCLQQRVFCYGHSEQKKVTRKGTEKSVSAPWNSESTT